MNTFYGRTECVGPVKPGETIEFSAFVHHGSFGGILFETDSGPCVFYPPGLVQLEDQGLPTGEQTWASWVSNCDEEDRMSLPEARHIFDRPHPSFPQPSLYATILLVWARPASWWKTFGQKMLEPSVLTHVEFFEHSEPKGTLITCKGRPALTLGHNQVAIVKFPKAYA